VYSIPQPRLNFMSNGRRLRGVACATLAAAFVLVVIATVVYGLISIRRALGTPQATAIEIGLGAVRGGGHG
jgi:hypothetical protein